MFEQTFRQTPFTTPDANDCFAGKIKCERAYGNDVVFLSVLRALLYSRMEDGDSLSYSVVSTYGSITGLSGSNILARVLYNVAMGSPNRLTIVNLNTSKETAETALGEIKTRLPESYEGWEEIGRFYDFFRQSSIRLRYFTNPDLESGLCIIDRLSVQRMQAMAQTIPLMLGWYFAEKQAEGQELELLKSLAETTSDHFLAILEEMAAKIDMRSEKLRRLLTGFEEREYKVRRDRLKTEIDNLYDNIRTHERQIRDYMRQISEKNISYVGLDTVLQQSGGVESSAIFQLFLHNEKLRLTETEGSSLRFEVSTDLTSFDEDKAEGYLHNLRSAIYMKSAEKEDMRMLLQAIFVDRVLKLRFCGYFELCLDGWVSAPRGRNFGPEHDAEFPNPHLWHYGCLGSYEEQLNRFMQNRNYVGAISVCINATGSLNFSDATVLESFGVDLCNNYRTKKAVVMPDGSLATPAAAVEWLKEQKNEKKEKEED